MLTTVVMEMVSLLPSTAIGLVFDISQMWFLGLLESELIIVTVDDLLISVKSHL